MVAGEVLAGLAIGFALQIGYSAAFVAGEVISNAMGLGFASMSDPQSGQSSPVIGTFLSVLATFLLLSMNGHLMLITFIVKSYEAMPPGGAMLSNDAVYSLRSEEHTSELQSLMRISYAVFCLKKKKK